MDRREVVNRQFVRVIPAPATSEVRAGLKAGVPDVGFGFGFFFFLTFWVYLFIYGCAGSPFLREGLLQPRQVGATPHRGARASHHRGLSRCRAQAPDAQAQQLWLTGLAAPRHVGSSQTRARTRVPCTGRQTLNHCATREALVLVLVLA